MINKLKEDTNYNNSIIYRELNINKTKIFIVYFEPLTSSVKISDFVIRSLNKIKKTYNNKKLYDHIKNNIDSFKVVDFKTYDDLCLYLNRGFTILLIENSDYALALETKSDQTRSISPPTSENTLRGAKDSFVEEYQPNIGMIKKRIRSNNLWIEEVNCGKYTNTQIGILSINTIVNNDSVKEIKKRINSLDIEGIINGEMLKNLIEQESKSIFPTIQTTERPDIVCNSLLQGKIAIIVDNSPYALILPVVLNDFFKTSEDYYGKNKNVTITRIIKYIALFIALLTPAIYISLITYNQEIIPTKLLVEFAVQRDGVPFPPVIEALIMIICFEILRESDYRNPNLGGSALSIVGALILGDAAVSAGIVSPIMIIVIAITAISSLPFSEPDITNALRWYRILFIFGASIFGLLGIVLSLFIFLTKLCSIETFKVPYLTPYSPTIFSSLKDSIIKFPTKKLNKRNKLLTKNIIKQKGDENES